jgi:hypothetical protein
MTGATAAVAVAVVSSIAVAAVTVTNQTARTVRHRPGPVVASLAVSPVESSGVVSIWHDDRGLSH